MPTEPLESIPDFTEIESLSGSRCDYCFRRFYGDHVTILKGRLYHKNCIPKACLQMQKENHKTEEAQV